MSVMPPCTGEFHKRGILLICTGEFHKRVNLLILMSGIMDEQSVIVTRRNL